MPTINLQELIRKSAEVNPQPPNISLDDGVEKLAEALEKYAEHKDAVLNKLAELAATTLREIESGRKEYEEKLARYNKAEQLTRKMLNTQEFTGEETLDKVAEFKQMSLVDLEIANKALDMIKSGTIQLGTLSDQPAPGAMDNLTYYLLHGE